MVLACLRADRPASLRGRKSDATLLGMAVAAIESALEQSSVADRAAHGRAARADAPRSSHADWAPADNRADPVDLLEEQAGTRVPELVPIRYGRMLASPFAFFR